MEKLRAAIAVGLRRFAERIEPKTRDPFVSEVLENAKSRGFNYREGQRVKVYCGEFAIETIQKQDFRKHGLGDEVVVTLVVPPDKAFLPKFYIDSIFGTLEPVDALLDNSFDP